MSQKPALHEVKRSDVKGFLREVMIFYSHDIATGLTKKLSAQMTITEELTMKLFYSVEVSGKSHFLITESLESALREYNAPTLPDKPTT